eukprot:CAMPEP_0171614508 /NCGR_PEP_ID=MMETSP0990-20121206/12356_1 /TAXON_ID=483369 /ORGANISM="non described non described, Strain CCMP2098" /LENGTH=37 /DNA_ID= /DNA_START= /DNA_END= /DNA_ORIENTATION=
MEVTEAIIGKCEADLTGNGIRESKGSELQSWGFRLSP